MSDYTHFNFADVKDSAAEFGMGELQEARFPGSDETGAQDTGFSHHVLKPSKRQGFGHAHENAEEVYVVIGGSGRAKLEDDVLTLSRLDVLRVAPPVRRAFEAGADGLELLAFGPRHEGDGEVLPDFWPVG